MTQEELAELLDVSVDAIGKYERSVSFIRGDIEHRLASNLGWNRQEIMECREDWESRQSSSGRRNYRVLEEVLVEELYDGSWLKASRAAIEMAQAELRPLPNGLEADIDVFLPIYETFRDHWGGIMLGNRMVAKWALPFLLPEQEARFRAGQLIEAELSVDLIRRAILPGSYFGYCPALIIRPGHEGASSLLLSSFVRSLDDLAESDVLLHGLGSVSVSPSGAQICKDLGMVRLGSHCLDASFGIWELPGAAVSGSVFGRRSAMARRKYAEADGR